MKKQHTIAKQGAILHHCKRQKKNTQKGITLVALVITIIMLLILATVSIRLLIDNGILTQVEKAVVLAEVGEIIDKTKLNSVKDEGVIEITGKLENVDIGLSDELIEKYNEVLYIKNGEVYLNFIADFPNTLLYEKNKNKIKVLKERLNICYDGIKEYNKIENPSFDNGLESWGGRNVAGNIKEVRQEEENNYLYIETHNSSGNTTYAQQIKQAVNKYGEKKYIFAKYRNNYIEAKENHTINNDIIDVTRGGGYNTSILSSTQFINSYQKGWKSTSLIRTVVEAHATYTVGIKLGGGYGNLTTTEYSVDFDNIYMINLTELFGEGNEPTKEEMDTIFNNF